MIVLPKCRYCGRQWLPRSGAAASRIFCNQCRKERRELAAQFFSLRPISSRDLDGPYLLPRRMRGAIQGCLAKKSFSPLSASARPTTPKDLPRVSLLPFPKGSLNATHSFGTLATCAWDRPARASAAAVAGGGISRSTWYRRRKQVREREALAVVATAREAVFDRLDWELAQLRRELETAARFADEGAVIITELAGYSGSSGRYHTSR